jgi:hypothetical protein
LHCCYFRVRLSHKGKFWTNWSNFMTLGVGLKPPYVYIKFFSYTAVLYHVILVFLNCPQPTRECSQLHYNSQPVSRPNLVPSTSPDFGCSLPVKRTICIVTGHSPWLCQAIYTYVHFELLFYKFYFIFLFLTSTTTNCLHFKYRISTSAQVSYSTLCLMPKDMTNVRTFHWSCAWPPPSLSRLYSLCWAMPWPMLRILTFSWFSVTVACCLHSFVTKSYKYGILNAMCKSWVGVRLGELTMVKRTVYCRRCSSYAGHIDRYGPNQCFVELILYLRLSAHFSKGGEY